jgi:phosphotransferase system enzyme I (PtsP)
MFPMVAEVSELEAAREILDLELLRCGRRGWTPPVAVEVGVMLEVPALLWQFPELLRRVDFLSVGTNDLVQFVFACDRGNPRLADRYDALSLPVLRLLAEVVRACGEYGVPLALCGEMAGQPLDAMALIGIGFRSLSMVPGAVGPVKAMIRRLDLAALEEFLAPLRDVPSQSLRGKLRAFALDHGVIL